jgi:hypothetical protein
MFKRHLIPVWIGVIVLSVMFLMGQETWPPQTGTKTVFVTADGFAGDFGGFEAADAICQMEADAAGLSGEYKAWLSTTTEGPNTRFVHATVPYVLVDGTQVADNWTDLTDGTLHFPIGLTASGGTPVEDWVWTNTHTDGTPANAGGADPDSDSCREWTSAAPWHSAVGGWSPAILMNWTYSAGLVCSQEYRLYCFQQ